MHSETLQERTVATGLIVLSGTRGTLDGIVRPSRCQPDRGAVGGGGAAAWSGVGARMALAAGLLAAALLICSDARGQGSARMSAQRAGARVALVIGNAAYESAEIADLRNPGRDAEKVGQALERAGFTVTILGDQKENQFHDALDQFGKDARFATAAVFYYAGHGIEQDGKNYLLPVDMEKPKYLNDAIDVAEVIESMQGRQNVVFLDACRTEPGRGVRGASELLSRGLVAVETSGRQIKIGYAAESGKPALDGKAGGNSPYAAALAAHLETPGLRLVDLLMRVGNAVEDSTEGEQVPWDSGKMREKFYFVVPPSPNVKPDDETSGGGEPVVDGPPVVSGDPLDKEDSVVVIPPLPPWEREWKLLMEIEDPGLVRAYIGKFKGNPEAATFVAAAEVRLDLLTKVDPPSTWRSPLGMEFVWIPAGNFVMGSPVGEAGRLEDEDPQHEVRISRGFWMGRYEVTQSEWEAVMGENPSHFKDCGPRCPVEQVSWNDVRRFIWELNMKERPKGYEYRLPTEAEWEYAARAGTPGARYGVLDAIAWHVGNSAGKTHPVGLKQANGWWLHDMLGNVWEWVSDAYAEYPRGSVTDPHFVQYGHGSTTVGSLRVKRGGSWDADAVDIRSAVRAHGSDASQTSPGWRSLRIGFRLVREKFVVPPSPNVKPDDETSGGGEPVVDGPPVVSGDPLDKKDSVVVIPPLPPWEREWELLKEIEDPGLVRAYIGKFKGNPEAATFVAAAEVRLDLLTKVDPLDVSGSGGGLSSGGGIGGGVSMVRVVRRVEPEYPEEARKAKHQGTVLLGFEVWEDGLAHNIRVLESAGLGLDEKAIEMLEKWTFRPAMKDGEPVRTTVKIGVNFSLL